MLQRQYFVDMGWTFGKRNNELPKAQQGGPDLAFGTEANKGGATAQGSVRRGEQRTGGREDGGNMAQPSDDRLEFLDCCPVLAKQPDRRFINAEGLAMCEPDRSGLPPVEHKAQEEFLGVAPPGIVSLQFLNGDRVLTTTMAGLCRGREQSVNRVEGGAGRRV